jgi:RNA polymerase sigma factor (sigma-70 family)
MDSDWLAQRFEDHRDHLRAVAYRMLGSFAEAEDAVQETWLRLNRADISEVQDLLGWLTTVTARACLDVLRSRDSRREDPFNERIPEPIASRESGGDPEQEAILADSLGPALLVVLEMLSPAERVAFGLHHVFAMPFEEIAAIVGRSPEAARQLASPKLRSKTRI